MQKLTRALTVAIIGIAMGLGMGLIMAQDRPEKPDRPDKPEWKEGRKGPEMKRGGPGGMDEMMGNPKIKEEMKRHREAMKGLFEKAQELRKKIREAIKAKIKELREQRKEERKNRSEDVDDAEEDASSSSEKAPAKTNRKEKMKELVEPYRGEAEAIAGGITAEILLHHQNLLNILTSEQAAIQEKITNRILMPPKPGMKKQGQEGKGDKMREGSKHRERKERPEDKD